MLWLRCLVGGCRWLGGSCRLGERCRFAHGGEELNSWNAATGKRTLTEEELSKQVNQALSTEHARTHPHFYRSARPVISIATVVIIIRPPPLRMPVPGRRSATRRRRRGV
eukprot:COSAG01_NODE_1513_length_10065_cov_63.160144_18_plen_110_part_00